MPLHQGQKRFINEFIRLWYEKLPRNIWTFILTCANRWGKSVEIACIQAWFLFYKIGIPEGDDESWFKAEYRTANIAPHSALTEPVFKTLHQILTSTYAIRDPKTGHLTTNKCLVEWWYRKDKTLNTPPYKQFFDNNAYIEHRSLGADQGGALQGKPYGCITYDEGGRSDHLKLEIDDAILARLFDMQGPLFILSTPSIESKSNLDYYELYEKGLLKLENIYTMVGSLRDNTFFSPEQIQAQYDLLKENPLRDQMLEGKFIFGGDTLFTIDSILAAQDDELTDGIRYEEGHSYAIGTDTAMASDEQVHIVLDITEKPHKLVRIQAHKGNQKSPQMAMNDFVDLVYSYWNPEKTNISHELETWNGESARFYQDLPDEIKGITKCYGSWQPAKPRSDNDNPVKTTTNSVKKADLLLALKKCLSAGDIRLPKDQKLIQQLSIYKEDDKKLKTDRVMALALAVYAANYATQNQEIAWETIAW